MAEHLDESLTQLRDEMRSALSEGSEGAQALVDCRRLAADFDLLKCQGMSHDWNLPLQRIRYLSNDAGLWLDSEPFSLGSFGPVCLRFYPRGARSADSRCALGLRLERPPADLGSPGGLPSAVDLSVSEFQRRAPRQPHAEGVFWLVEGFCELESLMARSAGDLCIRATLPVLQPPATSVESFADPSAAVASAALPEVTPPPWSAVGGAGAGQIAKEVEFGSTQGRIPPPGSDAGSEAGRTSSWKRGVPASAATPAAVAVSPPPNGASGVFALSAWGSSSAGGRDAPQGASRSGALASFGYQHARANPFGPEPRNPFDDPPPGSIAASGKEDAGDAAAK